MDTTEPETYIRNWLSTLNKDDYRDSIDQLEPIIQQWKKIRKKLSFDLVQDFNRIKSLTFREEFLKRYDYPHSAEIFDAMDNMLSRLTHTDKRLEWGALFNRLFSNTGMLRNVTNTHRILVSLKRARERLAGNENGFYIICFSLQLAMEGIYDDIVRFVYVTEQVIKGEPVDPDKIEHTEIGDIRAQIEMPQKEILDVWDDAHHIRNAIAHARFRYNQNDKKMTFIDVNPKNLKDVFSKTLSIEETQEIVNKIAVIEAAFTDLFALLEIYSTLLTPPDEIHTQPSTT